jgi:hypothetical protein
MLGPAPRHRKAAGQRSAVLSACFAALRLPATPWWPGAILWFYLRPTRPLTPLGRASRLLYRAAKCSSRSGVDFQACCSVLYVPDPYKGTKTCVHL